MPDPYQWVTKKHRLRKKRDLEELQTDLSKATSANSFSWIKKGNITMEFAEDAAGEILDIGCGWGRELIRLKNAVGIDLCLPFLQTAKNYVDNDVILADAHYLPFKDDSFSFIVVSEVLEHLENPVKVVRELRRTSKPKGKLLIQTPNKLFTMGKFIPANECGHVHEFTFPALKNLLEFSGFRVLQRTGSTIPYIPSTSRLDRLNSRKFFFSVWKFINRTVPLRWDIIVLSELTTKF